MPYLGSQKNLKMSTKQGVFGLTTAHTLLTLAMSLAALYKSVSHDLRLSKLEHDTNLLIKATRLEEYVVMRPQNEYGGRIKRSAEGRDSVEFVHPDYKGDLQQQQHVDDRARVWLTTYARVPVGCLYVILSAC